MDYCAHSLLAEEVIREAASILRDASRGFDVSPKGSRDLVTSTDFEIERRVRSALKARTPSIGFLGEEEGAYGATGDYWVLDPIDGTVNYASGLPMYAISLALVRDGASVAGAILLPESGSLFRASKGGGAFLDGLPLAVRDVSSLDRALVCFGDFPTSDGREPEREISIRASATLARRCLRMRMFGTAALDLSSLAAGRVSASLTWSNNSWDLQAGLLIATEAGAVAVDESGQPHGMDSRFTIACVPGVRDELVQAVRDSIAG